MWPQVTADEVAKPMEGSHQGGKDPALTREEQSSLSTGGAAEQLPALLIPSASLTASHTGPGLPGHPPSPTGHNELDGSSNFLPVLQMRTWIPTKVRLLTQGHIAQKEQSGD